MTKFYDPNGGRLEISMIDKKTGISWEEDFFDCGSLTYNEEEEAYMVEDVLYPIDYAEDYITGTGDFWGNGPIDTTDLTYTCNLLA